MPSSDFVDANVEAGTGRQGRVQGRQPLADLWRIAEGSCRFASGLASLGFGHESRMAMLALDTIEFPVAFWGAIRGGVVPMPLNTLLTTEQYVYMLEDSRAAVLFVSEALAKVVEPALSRMSSFKSRHRCRKQEGDFRWNASALFAGGGCRQRQS
jgi:4-hydroxybenzoate-CoA ligase